MHGKIIATLLFVLIAGIGYATNTGFYAGFGACGAIMTVALIIGQLEQGSSR